MNHITHFDFFHFEELLIKECSTYTFHNMDKTQKHYGKSKKPDKKDHVIWFYLHEMSRTGKSIEKESKLIIGGEGQEGKGNDY